jgi:transcriptional regulator with XRE-family HTH domain
MLFRTPEEELDGSSYAICDLTRGCRFGAIYPCGFPMSDAVTRKGLAAAIAARRTSAGLTQEQVGELIGLGQAVISRIESAQRKVESIELLDLARALGVDLPELLADAAARSPSQVDADGYELLALRLHHHDPAAVEAFGWVRTFLERLDTLERRHHG